MVKRSWLLLSCLVWGAAFAQLSVQTNVPEGSELRISHAKLSFDLGRVAFPPLAFPYSFAPTDLTDEPIIIELVSNIEGGWRLRVDFAGLVSAEGNVLLPSQIVYRLNGAGEWLTLGPSIDLLTGQGLRDERHQLELRLRLLGNERPGTYRGTLFFSLAPL
jgi:hypothetical protein